VQVIGTVPASSSSGGGGLISLPLALATHESAQPPTHPSKKPRMDPREAPLRIDTRESVKVSRYFSFLKR
jgi:hypothetical protein